MLKLIRLLVLVVLAPLVFALAYEAYDFLRTSVKLEDIAWLLYGFVFYLILYLALLKDEIRFLEALEHELSHTAVSLAFFHVPLSLKAHRDQGGEVQSARGDFLNALAPYYLPLFTLPLLLLKPFTITGSTLDKGLDFIIGFSLAFHYAALFREFRYAQPDIKDDSGRIFATVVVPLFNLIWLVIVLSVMTKNYGGLLDYFRRAWARTLALYTLLLDARQAGQMPSLRDLVEQSRPVVDEGR